MQYEDYLTTNNNNLARDFPSFCLYPLLYYTTRASMRVCTPIFV